MGPVTLFDKSFLEMLSVDQAALFDCLFSANLCPVFITEALADLSKKPPGQRSVEKIVSDLANKAPSMHSYPNAEHTALCLAELFGETIRTDGFPGTMGGRLVMDRGMLSVIYDGVEELEAFNRWQSGRFYEVERQFAGVWRQRMQAVDHREVAKLARRALSIEARPKTLEEAHEIARAVIDADGIRFEQLSVAFALLGLPQKVFRPIRERWVRAGRPPIREFAPYTSYCLHLELFFHICIEKLLISPDRASNRVDMAYLFYLPFCRVFVSQDKLHWRTAPLFMGSSQQLIKGADLKADLIKLDAYFSELPDEARREGLFRLASAPPDDLQSLTGEIWRASGMKRKEPRRPTPKDAEVHAKLMKAIKSLESAPAVRNPRAYTPDQLKQAAIKRMVPRRMGKWDMLPSDFKG